MNLNEIKDFNQHLVAFVASLQAQLNTAKKILISIRITGFAPVMVLVKAVQQARLVADTM